MAQHNIELVIFDLDGTLLNTIDDLAVSANYALTQHGYPTHDIAAYKRFVGNGVRKLIERALPEGARNADEINSVLADFTLYYNEHSHDKSCPYSGIEHLIDELCRRNIKLAVASNKYHEATQFLTDHYFSRHSFCTVYGNRDGIKPKPDPTIVFDILNENNISPDATLYVGDSNTDIQTAHNSGVRSVGVTWGFRTREELEQSGADYIIDTPEQLLDLIN